MKDFAVSFIFDVAGNLLDFDSIQVFIHQLMRRSLRGENEIRVGELFDEFAHRLSGIQIIAQIDGAVELAEFHAVRMQPAFDRFDFAVLFFVAVLRGDKLRYQRYSLIVSGGDHGGHHHGVEILPVLAFALPGRALIAFNFVRTVKFCAVYRNQDATGNVLKRFHGAGVLCQQIRHDVKGVVECIWVNAVKQVADVVVGGNALHTVQRLTVVATGLLLENSLALQKRR